MSAADPLHPMLHDMGDPAWRRAFADDRDRGHARPPESHPHA